MSEPMIDPASEPVSGPASEPILDVRGLCTRFPVKAGAFSARTVMLRAVDGVSFQLYRGETLGLVGESGCGKTTVGRSILRLYQPQAGRVFLDPERALVREVAALDAEADAAHARWQELRTARARGTEGAGADPEPQARGQELRASRGRATGDDDHGPQPQARWLSAEGYRGTPERDGRDDAAAAGPRARLQSTPSHSTRSGKARAQSARGSHLTDERDHGGGAPPPARSSDLRELRLTERRLRADADRRAAGSDILAMPPALLKQTRRRLQMVFQDPWASLNPRMLVRDLIAEGPREYATHAGPALANHVRSLLERVGLPQSAAQRYPHEFSGGQRQRIGIARALALAPSIVIADEPVSALDVSIQAQILNLLIELQEDLGLTYIFIAHDLAVVRYIAHRVAVMYLGKIVELGGAEEITEQPRHPYTISLMGSVPVANPEVRLAGPGARPAVQGDVPSPVNPPSGCPFHPRCAYAIDVCSKRMPELEVDAAGRALACHNPPAPGAAPGAPGTAPAGA